MAYQQRENSGAVFVNDKKEKGSQQPDRKGDALIGGVEYWVSGWLKKTNSGDQFLSLSFTPKEDRGGQRPAQQSRSAAATPDEEIPFAPNKV